MASPDIVDVALVLAVDVSSSIDNGDFALQMQGIAKALRQKDVFLSIQAGAAQAIAVILMQWSTSGKQEVAGPWRIIRTEADLEAAASAYESVKRSWRPGGTGMAAAIQVAVSLLEKAPRSPRQVIDISGDGEENDGGNLPAARAFALNRRITINGLPVITSSPTIADYYAHAVIGGEDAFTEPAETVFDFADAMHRKLLREILSPVT